MRKLNAVHGTFLFLLICVVMILMAIFFEGQRVLALPTDLPYWQFIHVDTVDPANSDWDQNTAISRMSIMSDTLYLSTRNEIEGGEVWRSTNGISWEQVNQNGFSTGNNMTVLVGASLNGHIYAGTQNSTSGAEIWRCNKCDGSEGDWEQVVSGGFNDANNVMVERIILYAGKLFATVNNPETGVEVWTSSTGESNSWQQCNTNQFTDEVNTELYAAAVFKGYFYVATAQWVAFNESTSTGTEVWRTTDCNSWTQVNTDGFDNSNNVGAWMEPFGEDALYVLTGNPMDSFELWRCTECDGSPDDWERVLNVGGGDTANTSGGMMLTYDGDFYIATGNETSGTEIWRTSDGVNWSQVNEDDFGLSGLGEAWHNIDVWSGMVYKNHLYFGTVNENTGGQLRRLLANSATLTLPEEGKLEVKFISVGGPADQTGCTGDFGLENPRHFPIFPNYLYTYDLTFPVEGYFPKNTDPVFYLTPDENCEWHVTGPHLSTNSDRAFISKPEPNTWIISWEDWTDKDFNDLHVEITFQEQISPFLQLPFDYERYGYASFTHAVTDNEFDDHAGTISSYFDHKYPTYNIWPNTTYTGVVTFHGYDSGLWGDEDPGFELSYNGHDGIDFAVREADSKKETVVEVLAAADGWIADIVPESEGHPLGNHVIITHTNGFATFYGHLLSFDSNLVEGGEVSAGKVLGIMGTTGNSDGPHIHFGVHRSGLKVDPFGWLPERFPDSNYGKSGDPDPWWQYNQDLASPKNARSDYLWFEELGEMKLSNENAPTTISSANGEVIATFPVDALDTAFRAEMWPTLNAPNIPDVKGKFTHGFALYAYIPGDEPVWQLISPVDIGIHVEAPGTGSINEGYHAYHWDSVAESWITLNTTYNSVTGMVHFQSDQLGQFALSTSISRVYLPAVIK